jgi:NADH-quinone oxidoreductase subunit H
VTAEAVLVAPHSLELEITEALADKLTGGAGFRHATFRGGVEVAFTPETSSGSAVIGRLDGIVFDITDGVPDDAQLHSLLREGARFASFLGVELAVVEDGVSARAVAPKSRAARAGLAPGDVVMEMEGVIVRGLSDFIPPPNAESTLLIVRRGPEQLRLRPETAGFRYSSPEALIPALLLVSSVCFGFFWLGSPVARGLSFLERRVCERLREGQLQAPAPRPLSTWRRLLRATLVRLPESVVPYLALVGESVVISLLAADKSVVMADLDAVVVPAATLTGLVLSAIFTGGGEARWSLRKGFARALAILVLNLPFAALLLATLLWAGTARPSEVVALQGVWPWQWAAFRSPLLGFLGLLTLLALVPRIRPAPVWGLTSKSARGSRFLELSEWVHALAVTGIVALLVLGGNRSPVSGHSLAAEVIGACAALAKSWTLLVLVLLLRWVVGSIDALLVRRVALLWLGLPAALALLSGAVVRALPPNAVLSTLEGTLGPVAFGTAIFALGWSVLRVNGSLRRSTPEFGIQPWL